MSFLMLDHIDFNTQIQRYTLAHVEYLFSWNVADAYPEEPLEPCAPFQGTRGRSVQRLTEGSPDLEHAEALAGSLLERVCPFLREVLRPDHVTWFGDYEEPVVLLHWEIYGVHLELTRYMRYWQAKWDGPRSLLPLRRSHVEDVQGTPVYYLGGDVDALQLAYLHHYDKTVQMPFQPPLGILSNYFTRGRD
jgi:hypothetical protein